MAAVLAVTVVVVLVIVAVVRAGRRRHVRDRERQHARWAAQERIDSAAARHEAVLEAFGARLVDFLAALERPALNDPGVAETERFDRARIGSEGSCCSSLAWS